MAKYYLILYFILFTCLFEEGKSCFLVPRVHVSITNQLPPNAGPIFVVCKSKDDDLGNHTLAVNQDFHFDFCVKPFVTLFYCSVRWGNKVASFDVYNAMWLISPCESYKSCRYYANDKGIFLGSKFWNNW
ncbi:hypothetical protein ACP275_06G173400 [Erythranthe tilingii]